MYHPSQCLTRHINKQGLLQWEQTVPVPTSRGGGLVGNVPVALRACEGLPVLACSLSHAEHGSHPAQSIYGPPLVAVPDCASDSVTSLSPTATCRVAVVLLNGLTWRSCKTSGVRSPVILARQ